MGWEPINVHESEKWLKNYKAKKKFACRKAIEMRGCKKLKRLLIDHDFTVKTIANFIKNNKGLEDFKYIFHQRVFTKYFY